MMQLSIALPASLRAGLAWCWPFRRKPRIERYDVRVGYEWAVFYIDEERHLFTCFSTCGTYAYIWRATGKRTLKEFLVDLDFDYFMGKARPGYKQFDPEASVKVVQFDIITARQERMIDRKEARAAWRDLDDIDRDHEIRFIDGLYDSEALRHALGDDLYEYARREPDGDSKRFWEMLWPEFVRQIGGARS